MNVGAKEIVLKSGAEDLTGMYNLKRGMKGTTGDMNKGDEEFVKRNHKDIKVIKFIFKQSDPSEYALVDAKYATLGKILAAKKKRRPKRSKRRSKKRTKKAKKDGANTPPPPPSNITTPAPKRGGPPPLPIRPTTPRPIRPISPHNQDEREPSQIVRDNAERGILSRDDNRKIAGAKNRRPKRRTKRRTKRR